MAEENRLAEAVAANEVWRVDNMSILWRAVQFNRVTRHASIVLIISNLHYFAPIML